MKLLRVAVLAALPVCFGLGMSAQQGTASGVVSAPDALGGRLPLPSSVDLLDRLLRARPALQPLIPSELGGLLGAPYSLVSKTTVTRRMADGRVMKSERVEHQMRDSEGRARTEHYVVENGADVLTFVSIFDRLDGENILLNPRMKSANVFHFAKRTHAMAEEQAAQMARIDAMRAKTDAARASASSQLVTAPHLGAGPATEPLGEKSIAGVLVEGTRITQVVPVGQMGNDREMTVVTETWISTDVHVEMAQMVDDPIHGKNEMVVTKLDRREPDARLFQVPKGYTVQDTSADGQRVDSQ